MSMVWKDRTDAIRSSEPHGPHRLPLPYAVCYIATAKSRDGGAALLRRGASRGASYCSGWEK